MKKIISIFVLIIFMFGMIINIPVYASSDFFVVTLTSDKSVIAKGDTITLTLSLSNISAAGGMSVLTTTLDFGQEFELATGNKSNDIVGKNSWTVDYNENTKFLTLNHGSVYVKDPGEMCTIKLKLKQTANNTSYIIKATNLEAAAKKTATSTAELIYSMNNANAEATISVKSIGAASNSVLIDGTKIKGIEPNTKVSQMSNYISGTYTIKNSSNATLGNNEVIASGMKLVVSDTEEYTIFVKGDLSGDGKVTTTDVVAMRNHMVGLVSYPYAEAGDIDLDGFYKANDLARIIDFAAELTTTI